MKKKLKFIHKHFDFGVKHIVLSRDVQALLRDGVLQGSLQQHQLCPRALRAGTDPGDIRHRHGTGRDK